MANPALDLATFLASQSTSFTLGGNIFVGPVRAALATSTGDLVPVTSGFFIDSAGPAPTATMGRTKRLVLAGVQLRFRTSSTSHAAGKALVDEAWGILVDSKPSGYLDVMASQGGPVYLRMDENSHHQWSLNFLAQYEHIST